MPDFGTPALAQKSQLRDSPLRTLGAGKMQKGRPGETRTAFPLSAEGGLI
jgi:hypothetical protein